MTKRKGEDEVKAFLGKGTEFDGKLMFSGSVRVDGNFKGEVSGGGTFIVGDGANIEADILVDSLLVSGRVCGSIEVREKVEIYSTGRILGSIKTPVFVVQEGAVFEGNCQMVNEGRDKNAEAKRSVEPVTRD
jgi:Integral membrane protein CcmA involved in cell shape determination